ncbi:MAG TPA: hypothetical protein VHG69_11395 [Thermoleophilaceae bacterium]|nr:hypothetical protein [Thermoleophilaceae bacterium]
MWGRELLGLELETHVGGAPSWKPLPVLLIAPLTPLGDGAVDAWLVLARATGLAGLPLAYLLAARLAGPAAGVVAVVALALSGGWFRGLEHGYCEPLVIAALLGAALAWLDARRGTAFALVLVASLARPECWPVLAGMAVWMWRRDPRLRPHLVAGVAVVPLLWVGVDWWSSGRFLNAERVAGAVIRDMSGIELLGLGMRIPPLPALLLAAFAAGYAAVRRELLPALLGAAVLGAAAALTIAAQLGYPPTERVFLPLAGFVAVLAGVGAAQLVRAPAAPGVRAAMAAGLALACLPFAVQRAQLIPDQVEAAREVEDMQVDLRRAAREARPAAPRTAAVALPRHLMWARGVIAWEWDVPMRRIGEIDDPPRGTPLLLFVPRPWAASGMRALATTERWTVLVDRPRQIRAFGRGRRG